MAPGKPLPGDESNLASSCESFAIGEISAPSEVPKSQATVSDNPVPIFAWRKAELVEASGLQLPF